jgi:hypothetical protein
MLRCSVMNSEWPQAVGEEHRKCVTQGACLQTGVSRAAHFAQLLVLRDAGYGGSVEVSRYAGDDSSP